MHSFAGRSSLSIRMSSNSELNGIEMWCHSNPLFLKNSKKNTGPSSTALFDCRAGYQRLRSAGNGKLPYSEEYMRSQTLLKPLVRVAAMILIMAGLAHGAEFSTIVLSVIMFSILITIVTLFLTEKGHFHGFWFWIKESPPPKEKNAPQAPAKSF